MKSQIIRRIVWISVGCVTLAAIGNGMRLVTGRHYWSISSIVPLDDVIDAGAINNRGQIVVWHEHGAAQDVLWNTGRTPTGRAERISLDGLHYARGVNDHGAVAGAVDAGNDRRPALRRANGGLLILSLAYPYGRANAVNDLGEIVGTVWDGHGRARPFQWDERRGFIDLCVTIHPTLRNATGINNSGWKVGSRVEGEFTRGYLWTPEDGLVAIDNETGRTSCAVGLNNLGHVVGHVCRPQGAQRAVIWDRLGGLVDLNRLLPVGSAWELHSATSINDRCQVLGRGRYKDRHCGFLIQLARLSQ